MLSRPEEPGDWGRSGIALPWNLAMKPPMPFPPTPGEVFKYLLYGQLWNWLHDFLWRVERDIKDENTKKKSMMDLLLEQAELKSKIHGLGNLALPESEPDDLTPRSQPSPTNAITKFKALCDLAVPDPFVLNAGVGLLQAANLFLSCKRDLAWLINGIADAAAEQWKSDPDKLTYIETLRNGCLADAAKR